MQVNVTLPEPIDSEAEGYIEVHGTLQSASTMNCSNYVVFPLNMTEDFGNNLNSIKVYTFMYHVTRENKETLIYRCRRI